MNERDVLFLTDSYKLNHWKQYPKDTKGIYSYFESREGAEYPYTVFFGLQAIIKKHLLGDVFEGRKEDPLDDLAKLGRAHFGGTGFVNVRGWEHIYWDHNGKLPLRIKAVPEGMKVPTGNVMMTVENTCEECFWLTNYLETLLVQTWYPSTVATLSTHTIERIRKYVEQTGGDPAAADFMLHDFGCRGASSMETAALGGAAHLISSRGTDTVPALALAQRYYGADLSTLGFSVPATEHSVMTARGEEGEMDILGQLLEDYPTGILSVVSDSYDIERFVERAFDCYADRIAARDGKLVFRPDSLRYEGDTPVKQMVELSDFLWAEGGGRLNEAGFREFDPHFGLLWGDGISPDDIGQILAGCQEMGYAASNYVFGMGGGLLQKVNRDTQRFAFKCSARLYDGEWVPVSKGAHGKSSKAGRLGLFMHESQEGLVTAQVPVNYEEDQDFLQTVFEDGELKRDMTFDEVRANTARSAD